MEKIKTLEGLSEDEIYASFNEAFGDYDRTWTRDEFEIVLGRRGYTPELSIYPCTCLLKITASPYWANSLK